MTNHSIGMQISTIPGSTEEPAVYVERHFMKTNSNGLVTLDISTGFVVKERSINSASPGIIY